MTAPLLVTAGLAPTSGCVPVVALVAAAWCGFLVAAVGDLYKSVMKARLGADVLVTSGIFRFLRHPNYTGEQLLWSANVLSAFAAAACAGPAALRGAAGLLAAALVGWAGIMFVLARATASLEAKQAERFEAYRAWRGRSWGGIALQTKK